MSEESPITNLFDFIDYLQTQNPVLGTANHNRAFIYDTIGSGFGAVTDPLDLQVAYESVGIHVPESAFKAISDLRMETDAPGNVIQIFAANSVIPTFDLSVQSGKDFKTDFSAYYTVNFYDPDIDEYLSKEYFLRYDDVFTPAELAQAALNDFETKYSVRVINLALNRVYRTFGN